MGFNKRRMDGERKPAAAKEAEAPARSDRNLDGPHRSGDQVLLEDRRTNDRPSSELAGSPARKTISQEGGFRQRQRKAASGQPLA
jgi:hypothetical protein